MSATPKHGQLDQDVQGIHVPFQYSFADSASRNGAPASRLSGGASKFALQRDNSTIWFLSDASPTPTWVQISGSGALSGNYLPLSGSEMSGSIAMQDNILERPEIKDYSEALSSATSSGSTYTIDLEQGNIHKVVLNADCTFSFANPPAAGRVGSFTLIAIQSSEGSKSATWPGTVDWASSTAPTLTDAANASDIFTFFTLDGGNQYFGFLGGGKMG